MVLKQKVSRAIQNKKQNQVIFNYQELISHRTCRAYIFGSLKNANVTSI